MAMNNRLSKMFGELKAQFDRGMSVPDFSGLVGLLKRSKNQPKSSSKADLSKAVTMAVASSKVMAAQAEEFYIAWADLRDMVLDKLTGSMEQADKLVTVLLPQFEGTLEDLNAGLQEMLGLDFNHLSAEHPELVDRVFTVIGNYEKSRIRYLSAISDIRVVNAAFCRSVRLLSDLDLTRDVLEQGIRDMEEGRTVSLEEFRSELGL